MKLIPRFIRKRRLRWPFWVSTCLATALLTTSFATNWFWFIYASATGLDFFSVEVSRGCVSYAQGHNFNARPTSYRGWELYRPSYSAPFRWTPGISERPAQGQPRLAMWVPLYIFAAPFALFSTISFFRAPLKHAEGHCPHCGYDLTGISDERCPECGRNDRRDARSTEIE
ncbi:MAG: hypothetical protein KDA20_03620 [Phycisphaerales bacterium]|nr:hypothetical protein [Phycisphaerales bacterium]